MNGTEKFMQARNAFSPEGETEIFGHFTKKGTGYFLRLFFGKFFWQCLVFTLLSVGLLLFFIFKSDGTRDLGFAIIVFFNCLGPFIYLISVLIGIRMWKYVKHVVVTNEGIWTASYGHPLRRKKSFDGKRRFFAIDWSVYDWAELSGLFEEQCSVSKICKLNDLIMVRWDGEHPVRFLSAADCAAITEYGKSKLNPKKKKKRVKKPNGWFEKFFLREP